MASSIEFNFKSCSFCPNEKLDLYKCPQCSAFYCSLRCYRCKKHSNCSEGFNRRQCEKHIESLTIAQTEQWKKINAYSQFNDDISINDQQFMHKIKERMKMDKTTDFVTKDSTLCDKITGRSYRRKKPLSGFSVYVGNIPYNATEADIDNLFSQCGVVTNVRIVYDRETNRPKGFGFCEFQDQQGAQNAVTNMNGAEFKGAALRVNWTNK